MDCIASFLPHPGHYLKRCKSDTKSQNSHVEATLTTCHVIHPVPSSKMSHAPVGHCLGLSMLTPSTGYRREIPLGWLNYVKSVMRRSAESNLMCIDKHQ